MSGDHNMKGQCPSCGGDCGRTAKSGCMYESKPERQMTWDEVVAQMVVYRNERDALRAGLDAALDFAGTVAGGSSWWEDVWKEHDAAISLLQSKLEKDDGEPVATAWALMKSDGGIRSLSWYKPSNESLQIAAIENEVWTQLFTHPAPKPMTDEGVLILAEACQVTDPDLGLGMTDYGNSSKELIDFARAVEARCK